MKPISVLPGAGGNYTVYAGGQVIWTGSAGNYYAEVGFSFAVALVAVWFLQKRLTVGTGLTFDKLDHGVGRDRLDGFVEQLDESLRKLGKHGIVMQELPTEGDTYVRGFRLSDEEENSITARIQPFSATVEAPVNDFRSLEAAREVMKCIAESPASEPSQPPK